jgi:hypothetical protein
MHARHLVELGAWVALRGTAGLRPAAALGQRDLEDYWLASRYRQDRWARILKSAAQLPPASVSASWHRLRPAMQEVLATELLTRTWAAVACAHDRQHGAVLLEPFVVHVLESHMEARQRVMQLVVRGHGCSLEEGVLLNRLRRHTERWTDRLLGHLACDQDVARFAFQSRRALECAADARDAQGHPLNPHATQLAWTSLRAFFTRELTDVSPNADLNARIARSILACCDGTFGDSFLSQPADWLLRLTQLADDAVAWIDDLLQLDRSVSPASRGQ